MDKLVLDRQISEAIGAHAMWRTTLREAAKTGVLPKSAHKIGCDDDCPFGKWLHSLERDPNVIQTQAYERVVQKHALFHSFAGEVATYVENGDTKAAGAKLSTSYMAGRSYALLDAMLMWQAEI
ncbi:CZB domain-containing protein [Celeribacter marinus]|uniref:CZB domain-containing protein n=1 Tax=Celeribacter marinus TaxID=1397108 RepID=UPI003F6C4155